MIANINLPVGGRFNKVWVPDGTTDAENGKANYLEGVAVSGIASIVFAVGTLTFGGETVTLTPVEVNMATAGPTTIVAANATQHIYVVGYKLTPDLNTHVEWLSASTVILNPEPFSPRVQYGGMFLPGYLARTAINQALRLQQTDDGAEAPATIRGTIWYFLSAS